MAFVRLLLNSSLCAQSLYAIKVLRRCHGMNDEELRLVFKTVMFWLRFYMQPQLGGGLPQLLIGNELRHLSVAVCDLVSTGQATQP